MFRRITDDRSRRRGGRFVSLRCHSATLPAPRPLYQGGFAASGIGGVQKVSSAWIAPLLPAQVEGCPPGATTPARPARSRARSCRWGSSWCGRGRIAIETGHFMKPGSWRHMHMVSTTALKIIVPFVIICAPSLRDYHRPYALPSLWSFAAQEISMSRSSAGRPILTVGGFRLNRTKLLAYCERMGR